MEEFDLKEDIRILCIRATSFPMGVKQAFDKLGILPDCQDRTFYGISRMDEKGQIVYKAAATEMADGEAERFGLEAFTIPKGLYLAERISQWTGREMLIGETFKKLIADPRMDNTFPCVEWYNRQDEVLCMVRMEAVKA